MVKLGAAQVNHSLLLVILGAAQVNHSLLLVILGVAQVNHSLLLVIMGFSQINYIIPLVLLGAATVFCSLIPPYFLCVACCTFCGGWTAVVVRCSAVTWCSVGSSMLLILWLSRRQPG